MHCPHHPLRRLALVSVALSLSLASSVAAAIAVGDVAPDISATTTDGKPARLADLRGKAVWLNFWASWCPPCQSETPVLRDVADRYADRGLVVIGISVQETSAANVAAYAAKYQLDYTIAADVTGEIYRLYHPPGLPTSIFIGPEGAVHSFVLAPLSQSAAIAQVEAILPDRSTPSLNLPPSPAGSPLSSAASS